MKFRDCKIRTSPSGIQWVRDDVVIGLGEGGKCIHCGDITPYIDIDAETYVCSDECQRAYYSELSREIAIESSKSTPRIDRDEPLEPIWVKEFFSHYECQGCGVNLGTTVRVNYCPECGQRVRKL